MELPIWSTTCSTCTATLGMFPISEEDHDLLKDIELCDADCVDLHPSAEPCRVCAQVRRDQAEAAKWQDANGFGPDPLPKVKIDLRGFRWPDEIAREGI